MDNGVLKVGKKYADKLTNETVDPWFEMIGESSTALLLKLYSQVCVFWPIWGLKKKKVYFFLKEVIQASDVKKCK